MIKVVIFDADGVLINAVQFSKTLSQDYGVSTETTLPFFNGKFRDCLVGKADLKEELDPHLKTWGWKGSTQEFLNYWFESEHNIDQDVVNEVLNLKTKGIKCYLATNQEKYRTQYIVEKMGFGEIFDGIYSSAHIGHSKPDHKYFEHVVQNSNVNKSETLFFDDTKENVDSANNFGIHAELYTDLLTLS